MLRAVLIGTVAAAAIGGASPANAPPAPLIGPIGGLATAPAPCDYISKRTGACVESVDANPVGAIAMCADGLYSPAKPRASYATVTAASRSG